VVSTLKIRMISKFSFLFNFYMKRINKDPVKCKNVQSLLRNAWVVIIIEVFF